MLTWIGTTLLWLLGNLSDALGKCGALPSTVKICPGTLLLVPIFLRISASPAVIVPNAARPPGRGGAAGGTMMSWIIYPSYQPLSLLMTNSGEMSVNTSLKARGSLGSVGSPGLGSRTTRTAPIVGSPQFPPVTVN